MAMENHPNFNRTYSTSTQFLIEYTVHLQRVAFSIVIFRFRVCTPQKINMEPENHLFEKENHLQKRHFWVPCLFSDVYPFGFPKNFRLSPSTPPTHPISAWPEKGTTKESVKRGREEVLRRTLGPATYGTHSGGYQVNPSTWRIIPFSKWLITNA